MAKIVNVNWVRVGFGYGGIQTILDRVFHPSYHTQTVGSAGTPSSLGILKLECTKYHEYLRVKNWKCGKYKREPKHFKK